MLNILKITSNFLSRIWNRQLLVFLFFLILSMVFWAFLVGKEQREAEFEVELSLTDVPDNVVVTTEPPKHITITLRDEVFTLLNYKYNRRKNFKAAIHWPDVATSSGHVRLLTTSVLKAFTSTLHSTTEITSIRPDTIDFYYNYGQSKRVPVVIQGTIEPDSLYSIIAADITPRNITVYASRNILDTVTAAYIEPVNLHNLTDTTSVEVKFRHVSGMKYAPDHATLTVYADRMVEKTVSVPVRGVNFPAGKTLRTFPPKVDVTFLVGTSLYKKIDAESFVIVVNYADIVDDESSRCSLQLKSTPFGVQRARIIPGEVEYVVEEE